ncbi:mevalonate kinase [Sporosarcina oncorhynchi]|uniref:mevalonate kinase n=1 Tax=Sporosarcina oncorhynchi TaxID=3056444 RepID=A0ABZ0LA45_9BACL|nr:mevalonate kinase [Sporosarcina sp. T2O-4]WOV89015.1 mevalonate kinase [Sporosarcina sp. T2O-4]
MSRRAEGKAHGKIIMIGEHSVVYDKPAIAIPFHEVNVTALVEQSEPTDGENKIWFSSKYFNGVLLDAPDELSGIKASVDETFDLLNVSPTNLNIHIDSSIPSGRGLGSSAAVAHAVVKAIFNYYDAPLRHDVQMHLVQIAETHAHGNPSGIDMEATCNDSPIWFQKGKETTALLIDKPLHIIVADSGRFGDTRTAVEGIRFMYRNNPAVARRSIDLLGDYTYECQRSLATGNLQKIGECLNLAQDELAVLGVSDPSLDHLIHTARLHGALGAKLTGGGRGGCILVLAQDGHQAQIVSTALKQAGAYQTWTSVVG